MSAEVEHECVEEARGGSRISEKGGLLMTNNEGEGAVGVTPPTQPGGLGERCKLPQRGLGRSPRSQRFLLYHAQNTT